MLILPSNVSADASGLGGRGFAAWLTRHGVWGVYVRADRRLHCPCWDPATQSSGFAPGLCPDCFGIGYRATPERCKAHVGLDTSKNYSTTSGISPAYIGEDDTRGAILYVRGNHFPRPLDLFLECEWDVPYGAVSPAGTPTRLLRAWRLKQVSPAVTGPEGFPDYWLSGLESHMADPADLSRVLHESAPRLAAAGRLEHLTPTEDRPYGGTSGSRRPSANAPTSVSAARLGPLSRTLAPDQL